MGRNWDGEGEVGRRMRAFIGRTRLGLPRWKEKPRGWLSGRQILQMR